MFASPLACKTQHLDWYEDAPHRELGLIATINEFVLQPPKDVYLLPHCLRPPTSCLLPASCLLPWLSSGGARQLKLVLALPLCSCIGLGSSASSCIAASGGLLCQRGTPQCERRFDEVNLLLFKVLNNFPQQPKHSAAICFGPARAIANSPTNIFRNFMLRLARTPNLFRPHTIWSRYFCVISPTPQT